MRWIYSILFVVFGALLSACGPQTYSKNGTERGIAYEKFSAEIQYFKDKRTEFCFAARDVYGSSAIMTIVPCTEKVLELLENK